MICKAFTRHAAACMVASLMLAPSAHAAESGHWNRGTPGAFAWGVFYQANGYLVNRVNVKDSVSDGNCAYVETQFEARYLNVHGLAVPRSIGSFRTQVCGYERTQSASHHVGRPQNRLGLQGVTMYTRVCRNDSWGRNNCSGWLNNTWTL